MATVSAFTLARSLEIEAATVVNGSIDGSGHLILETHDGTFIDAGSVTGALGFDLATIEALTPSANDILQFIAGAWANRTVAQVKISLAIAQSDVTSLVSDLALKAPLASPTHTGLITAVDLTQSGRHLLTPEVLTVSSGLVATDASLGNHFRFTANAAFTLSNPTNPVDGQRIDWEILQDGTGSRVMTLGTAFAFGTDITTAVLTTTANKTDYLGAIYNSTAAKWRIVAFVKGY